MGIITENYHLVYHHAKTLRFIGILSYPKIITLGYLLCVRVNSKEEVFCFFPTKLIFFYISKVSFKYFVLSWNNIYIIGSEMGYRITGTRERERGGERERHR